MYQIDHPTAVAELPDPDPTGDPGYFTGGDPEAVIPPTDLPADFMNTVMLELLNVVIGAGITPVKGLYNQVLAAINVLINDVKTSLVSQLAMVGEFKLYSSTTVPAGWLNCTGGTIGSAASGATARANADTQALFTHLWNAAANAELPIQTSAGAGSTRGVSAAADFAANKRLPLPDTRGVVLRGLDQGRGFGAQTAMLAYLADALQGHRHSLPGMPQNGTGSSYGGGGAGVQAASNVVVTGDVVTDGVHGDPVRVADATRDKSLGVVLLIKL